MQTDRIEAAAATIVAGMAADNVSLPHVEATPTFFLAQRFPTTYKKLSADTQAMLNMAVVNEIRAARGARPYRRLGEQGYTF